MGNCAFTKKQKVNKKVPKVPTKEKTKSKPKVKNKVISFGKFIEIPLLGLKTIGICIIYDVKSQIYIKVENLLYLSAVTVFFCILGETIFFVQSLVDGIVDFLQISSLLSCVMFMMLAIAKVTALIITGRFSDFANGLDQCFPTAIDDQKDYEVESHCQAAKRSIITYFCVVISFISVFVIFLAIDVGSVDKNGNWWPLDFIYHMWYPFDPYHHGIFEFIYLVHGWASYASIVAVLCVDCLLLTLLQQICMHFYQLTKAIQTMNETEVDKATENQFIIRFMDKHTLIIK